MSELEIGRSKRARQTFSFDDIAIVPSRRTRDPEDVSINWQIDAYKCEIPLLAAPMDSVMSIETAIEVGKLGGIGVLNLEGLWTRYENPMPLYEEIAKLEKEDATRRMQEIYKAPIKAELITERLKEIRAAGVTVAGALSPARVGEFHKAVVAGNPDLFVIRGTTVSAEHVAKGGEAHTTRYVLGLAVPMASAVCDVSAARREYLDESGGRYVHVIADGSVGRSGDIAKAIACGADAVMMGSPLARAVNAPGAGWHWGSEAHHPELPRGERVYVGTVGTLQEILLGPSHTADGSMNLFGALRRAMATTGYSELKEFQRVEVVIQSR